MVLRGSHAHKFYLVPAPKLIKRLLQFSHNSSEGCVCLMCGRLLMRFNLLQSASTGSASGLDTTQANDHHLLVTRTESASESWPEHLRRLRVESFTGVLAKNSPHLAG